MLHYAVVFFIIALIAALFGFTGIAAGAAGIAKILFIVFLVFAVVAFLAGQFREIVTMNSINDAAEDATQKAAGQLGKFFDDLEDLLRRVTRIEDADIARLRGQVESKLEAVRDTAVNGARRVTDTTVDAARTTDRYVHEQPWAAIGITAVACLAVGALITRR